MDDLHITTQGYKVYDKGEEVKFTNREFQLLLFLAYIIFSKKAL